MKKWSKVIVLCLVLTMVSWTLGACGNSSGDKKKKSDTYTATEVTSELPVGKDVKKYLKNIDMDYAYDLTETLAYSKKIMDCDLGWRTSGSDAEHRASEYLEKEMKKIGLKNVERVATPCDRFQFNGSQFTITDTKINLKPASYQCNGTGTQGLQAEIVDVNHGTEADYEGKDVRDKIVLAGVDQKDESWIDGYIREAHKHGAAALVSYSRAGYGQANDDTINVQDICCPDLIPTCAISKNQAKDVQIRQSKNWQGSTLALINCELPGFKPTGNKIGIGAVPEFRTLTDNFINKAGLVVTEGDVKMDAKAFDSSTMEDGVSYR